METDSIVVAESLVEAAVMIMFLPNKVQTKATQLVAMEAVVKHLVAAIEGKGSEVDQILDLGRGRDIVPITPVLVVTAEVGALVLT